jgi:putative transposase
VDHAPWRDLPDVFGDRNSAFRRFSRKACGADHTDFEYLIVDYTIVCTHQHAAGANKWGLTMRPRPPKPSVVLDAAWAPRSK